MQDSAAIWAAEEFGDVALGDPRRTQRCLVIVEQLARRPAGRITDAFPVAAEREATYRFVESDQFSVDDLVAGPRTAAARRAASYDEVVVPVDGVTFTMAHKGAGFGPVSTKHHAKGAHAMTALGLTTDGVPLGVLGQVFWTRSPTRSPTYNHDQRPLAQRETVHWLTARTQATQALRHNAPTTRRGF